MITDPEETDERPGIRGYLDVLRRRWLIVTFTVVVVAGASLASSLLETPRYRASSDLVVDSSNPTTSLGLGLVGVLEVTGATGPGPGALAFATAPGSAPLWGGTVLIDLALLQLALPLVLDSAGYGTLGLPIPQNPNLLGKQIYVQAFALDPSAPYGLLLSNGLEIQACPQ